MRLRESMELEGDETLGASSSSSRSPSPRSQPFRMQMQSCDRRGFADPTCASDILKKFAVGHIIATGATPPFLLIPSTVSYLNTLLNEQYLLTLLPAGRFPFFLYAVLGHEIERVWAELHFFPLVGAGLADPEGIFVHQNGAEGADLVDAAGGGVAGGAGLVHTAGMIVDGATGGTGLVHSAGMVVDGAVAGGAGLMHAAPDMIVDKVMVGVDLVNAAGLGVGFVEADGIVVDGSAAGAGLVDVAGMHDPQVGVAGGAGTLDAAMQHHITCVSEIIESEDECVVLDDLPQQEAAAVVPINVDILPINQPPQ